MCPGFVCMAVNLRIPGLKIIVGYLKKNNQKNQPTKTPFETTLLAMKSPCKLNFNASSVYILKNTIHKAENNPLFFDCSHQLVLTNMFKANLKRIYKIYPIQSRVTTLLAGFHYNIRRIYFL